MASTVALGSGRLPCARRERSGLRPPVRLCLAKCEARSSESGTWEAPSAVKAILPSLMAAALLHASAAHAGVVYKKREGTKVLQGQPLPAPSLPKFTGIKLSAPELPNVSAPDVKVPVKFELDGKTAALPVSVVAIGAAVFVASRYDEGFNAFLDEGLVKDSSGYTGYEEDPPQARGSPRGFLGLGNLYEDAGPGAKVVAAKARQIAGSDPRSPFQNKPKGGTLNISNPLKGVKNPLKGVSNPLKGKGKGLFS